MTEFVVPPPPAAFVVPPPPPAAEPIVAAISAEDQARLEAYGSRFKILSADAAGLVVEIKDIRDKMDKILKVGQKFVTAAGVTVSKRAPNRSYSEEVAISHLTEEDLESCQFTGTHYDSKLIKAKVEAKGKLDDCMLPGTGSPVVEVK